MCHSVCQKKKNNKEVNFVITMYTRTQCVVKNQGFKFTLIYMLLFTFLKTFIFQFREIGDVYGLFCFQQ